MRGASIRLLLLALISALSTLAAADPTNNPPIADAGFDRYAGSNPVTLDGTESYDPNGDGVLSYQWTQVSGPTLNITGENTPTPLISGFSQTSVIQECEFELIVSDGDLFSKPDTVRVTVVPSFSGTVLVLENPLFDPDKPTLIYFAGGSGGYPLGVGALWEEKANIISFSTPHNGGKFAQHGNAIITYLSSKAPNYNQQIQTSGYSNGGKHPAAVGAYINMTYADKRYNVNQATLFDPYHPSLSEITKFINSSVGGEQSWVADYRGGPAEYNQYPGPEINGALNVYFPLGSHSTPISWYLLSIDPDNLGWIGDVYNNGIAAGAYYSVIGPGKNLELAPHISDIKYHFEWEGPNYGPGNLKFYNESSHPGRLPEPVTLVGPPNGNSVDASGTVLSCEVSENAVGYQLLLGPDPYHMDYLISDTASPPTNIITAFPFETTYWTIKARDQYGSTIYADPICIKPEKVSPSISSPVDQQYLACTGYELVSQKRLSRTEFEYCFRMKVKNMWVHDVENIIAELKSTPSNITVLNNKVFIGSIPVRGEVLSEDTFIVRIDRSFPTDENDIIWEISDQLEGDFSGDDRINSVDLGYLAGNWLQTGADMPEDLYRDEIINFIDFTIFAEKWLDRMPFVVKIISPQDGDIFLGGQQIVIEADAWAVGGSVVEVGFFANANSIGEDSDGSNGWEIIWNLSSGHCSLTAEATDDKGTVRTSVPVGINVTPPR